MTRGRFFCHPNISKDYKKPMYICAKMGNKQDLAQQRSKRKSSLAGEEMLRSKDGNSNSYNASDEINNIDWEALTPGSDVMRMRDFYRALIAMRKANPFLTEASPVCTVEENNVISVQYFVGRDLVGQAFINPNDEPYTASFIGLEPGVLLRGWEAYETPDQTVTGDVQVEGHSVLLVSMP